MGMSWRRASRHDHGCPRPARVCCAARRRLTGSSLARSGRLTSGTVVASSRPNSSRVGSFTDSVRVPAANAVVPLHLRIDVHLRAEQYPKRRQGAQLIGVKVPFLKTLGGRRRSQEAMIRELANELREQPSA
jgi:hypothetical protein